MSKVNATGQEQARLAIASASRVTGVDFDYLLAQAKIESGLNPAAKAATSSAAGLYQFTKSTWLGMLDRHGGTHGVDWASEAISGSRTGHRVNDPLVRQDILALRHDPGLASVMAAEFAKENGAALRPVLGREPDHAELYLAHFLGATGAGKFLTALQSNPDQSAALLFPAPAVANRSIFFAKDGSARSLADVMDVMRAKVEAAKVDEGGSPLPSEFSIGSVQTAVRGPLESEFARYASAAPPLAQGVERKPMSSILLEAFGQQGRSTNGPPSQVMTAYKKLQGFGL